MIKTLMSIRFRALFTSMQGKGKDGKPRKVSPWKVILIAFLLLYFGGVFAILFTGMAITMGQFYLPLGNDGMYYGMFMLIGFSMVFIFSIFETKSELFDCKDNELLLSMPIRPHSIVISRIATVLLYNYVETSLVMLPAIVVYALMGGSPGGIIGGVLVLLLLPLLATSLSSYLGYLMAVISKRIKYKTLVTTVISIVCIVAYMSLYSGLLENVGSAEDEAVTDLPFIPAIAFIGKAATLAPIHTVVFTVLCIGAAITAYKVISASYTSIITNRTTAARREYKSEQLVRRSPVYALTIKEIRRFFSSSVYILNSSLGSVFAVLLAVSAVVKFSEISSVLTELGLSANAIYPVLTASICVCSAFNMPSAASISLEGKSFWILKSMPITPKQILISKLLAHIIITEIPTLLASLIVIVGTGAYGIDMPFLILLPLLTNILFGVLGLIFNTAFPKFDYTNEAQPIKQSLPIFLMMLVSAVSDLLAIGVSIVSVLLNMIVLGYIVLSVLLAAMSVGFIAILLGPSAKKLAKL